jgi:glycerol-3-phosphate O-acyltransferase
LYFGFLIVLSYTITKINKYYMQRQSPYQAILPQATAWPVVKMQQHLPEFLQAVINKAVQDILALEVAEATTLRQELLKSLVKEQERIDRRPWKVDRADDKHFWTQIIAELGKEQISFPVILSKIVTRYAQEIVGGFSVWHYRLAQTAASYTLNRLLNPIRPKRLSSLAKIQMKLQKQIHVLGPVQDLRALAQQGTIVMVPTHCSHFDSVLLWWVIELLGLPPFIYGAGRNLFNRQFFAYFMNKLGTYKVDRRRKNIAYLATLKAYSTLALHWGCHSLFYPGGTRARSGALEASLKLGLLGTALEAQHMNFQLNGELGRKIFVVPVILNYHFVLEAPLLIRDYLAEKDGACYSDQGADYSKLYKLVKFIKNVATKESSIFVSIGQPMDVLGNPVDASGNSLIKPGIALEKNLYATIAAKEYKDNLKAYTRQLGQAVVKRYYQSNYVISSQLLAFVAFAWLRHRYAHLADQAFYQLPTEQLLMPYANFEASFTKVRDRIMDLAAHNRLKVASNLKEGSISGMILDGLINLGVYHIRKPLLRNQAGDLTTQDLPTLFYYHNRLTGYGLEKYL